MAYEWQIERKQVTRDKILHSAMKYIKTHGLQGSSVANIMKYAGLTVGGFYSHFKSKEDLIKYAFAQMTNEVKEMIKNLPGKNGKERAQAYFEFYLSPKHRDSIEKGCPIAALASEMSRENIDIRRLFADEFEGILRQRKEVFNDKSAKWDDQRAMALMSTYVGALILSRATKGTELSEKILLSSKNYILKELENL